MSSVVNSYRTFIAIALPQSIRALIVYHIDQLRSAFPNVRASWLREDNLHLTLKFLGDVPIARIPALSDAVAEAARSIEPFDLIVSGCGSFPPHGPPKVLWIGVSSEADSSALFFPKPNTLHPNASLPPTPLSALHAAIERKSERAGFPRDPRPFHPHLTIARLRKPAGSRRLAEAHRDLGFGSQRFTASELVVFRSDLLREGSRHSALSRHQLASKQK